MNNRIEINKKIMFGKPVIRGTRITVDLILRLLAQGLTFEEILETYHHLKREDILACLDYATNTLEGEKVFSLEIRTRRELAHVSEK